jgi:aminopeptidase-like protein
VIKKSIPANKNSSAQPIGERMYAWAEDLFPICRSLSGEGVRSTLAYFQSLLPKLTIHEVKSGTQVFDWTVPDEWNIKDAYIADQEGNRVVDFQENNLHVVGYSEAIDVEMSFEELDKYLYSLPDQPEAIPYITSYYKKRWGFCLSHKLREQLQKSPKKNYKVRIDSSLAPGSLTYGELLIPGKSKKEILLSTYICHPSMANNELSGPIVVTALAQWLSQQESDYSYRLLFIPETIGSIIYIHKNLDTLKSLVKAGFVVSCVGDNRDYSYVASRKGDTLADRAAKHVLNNHVTSYTSYSYLERGSDERQYCSPGVDLPVCSICRTKYGQYPEYHTSLDNLELITAEGLEGAFSVYKKVIQLLEANAFYKVTTPCEPQLGKRGLYPTISTKDTKAQIATMMNVIAYADGDNDLIALAEKIGACATDLIPIVEKLLAAELLEKKPL